MQDEKAHKLTFDVKGAGGLRFCVECQNVLRCKLDDVPPGGYFKHLSEARPSDFDPQTPAGIANSVRRLREAVAVMGPGAFEEEQRVTKNRGCRVTA